MESLFNKFTDKIEVSNAWKKLNEEEKKKFKSSLVCTFHRLSEFLPENVVKDICDDEHVLTKLFTLFFAFFATGAGSESTFKELSKLEKIIGANRGVLDEEYDFSQYQLFHVSSTDSYYSYDKCNDLLDEITKNEFIRLLAHDAPHEVVLDGYEIKFIINELKA